jgi:hypothetical protein
MRPEIFLTESAWALDEAADLNSAGESSDKEGVHRFWKRWKRSIWARSHLGPPSLDRFLSPSGRYLAVIESLPIPFNRTRINIVDLKTGKLKGGKKN